MLQAHAKDLRSRLRLTASVLVVAAAGLSVSAATAQTVTVTSGGSYDLTAAPATTYVVPTGVIGEVHYDNSAVVIAGAADLTAPWVSGLTGGSNASRITVNSGGTLHMWNPWYWAVFTDMINAQAGSTVVIENHGDMNFFGSNTFNGDLWLRFDPSEAWSPPVVNLGQDWNRATTFFGTTSRIIMDNTTVINFWEPHSVTNTINMFTTTSGTATINFNNGTMIVNGVNTTSAPFAGTVTIAPGATFMVGDSTHATAVFGDPAASNVAITVNQSGGTVGSLKGYGAIYGNVTNNSLVAPGGITGAAGTLTIHGNYTQSAAGELVVEVTPTGVSRLNVTGTGTLAGTMLLKIDDGNYTAPGLYTVLSAGTKVGSVSAINVQGNAAFVGVISTATGYDVAVESQNSAQTFAHQLTAERYNVVGFSRSLLDRLGTDTGSGKRALWITPFGSVENISRDGLGFNATTYGARAGYEYHSSWKNAAIGVALSYGNGSMDAKGEASSADHTNYTASVYGGLDLTYARVDGNVFVGRFDTTITRDLGTIGTVVSAPSGNTYGASVQVSRSLFHDWVTPYAAGYFARVQLGGDVETGNSNFALAFDSIDQNYLAADIGLKVHVIRQEKLKLDVNVAIEHDFSDRGERASAGFANITGSSADYVWKGDAENSLIIGAYLANHLTDRVDVYARVNGEFSLYKRAADFSIGAKYRL